MRYQWIADLKRDPQCSDFLLELLDYVQSKMLQVQKEDRDPSKAVSDRLKGMLNQCKGDEGYALRGRPRGLNQKKTVAKSKSAGPKRGASEVESNRTKRQRLRIQPGDGSHQGPASRTRSQMR